MKKFYSFLAAGLMLTACSSEKLAGPETGTEQEVVLSFQLPESINARAAGTNSALGGASNCSGDITFTAALYYNGTEIWRDDATAVIPNANASVTFKPTLVIGEKYQLVAYAQMDGVISDFTAQTEANAINDESVDAYYVSTDVVAEPTMSATLKRATAKLRIIAEDFAATEEQLGKKVANVAVTYRQAQATELNPTTGVWAAGTETAFGTAELVAYSNEADAKTILVDYIPATAEGEIINIESVVVTFDDNTTYTKDLSKLDVPVKRNWLTTLTGNFFMAETELKVEIDDAFEGENTENYNILTAFEFGGEYALESDVTIDGSLILAAGKSLVLDLNGHNITINNESVELEEGDAIIAYGNLTIKGEGTVTANTRAIWARGNTGAVVNIEGGTFIGSTVAEDPASTVYASGNGTVNIYGGTFEATEADKTSYANKDGVYAAINMNDACTGGINVYGGTFVKFNPAEPGTELASWIASHPNGFVAPGSVVVEDGDNFIVVPTSNTAETLTEALNNDDIVIIDTAIDNGTNVITVRDNDVVMNMGGNQYVGGGKGTNNYAFNLYGSNVEVNDANIVGAGFAVMQESSVTLNNGSIAASPGKSGRNMFYVLNNSTVTVNEGTYTFDRTSCYFVYVDAGSTCYINGGHFEKPLANNASKDSFVNSASTGTVIITGGTFNVDPTAWLADGYKAVKEGKIWTVSAE